MWFLYLLGIVIALVIDYVIARKFADIAEMKGHEGSTYFWFTFIFGVVGMLMVVALPNVTAIKVKNTSPEDTSTQFTNTQFTNILKNAANTQKEAVKRCPYCGDVVKLGRCEMCGKEVK